MSAQRDQTYRTFVAIELPPKVRVRIAKYIDELRRNCLNVRASWTREENLHLTLKFLGDVPAAQIANVSRAIEHTAGVCSRLDLVISGCGVFPPHGQPKVLWIGVMDVSGELARLQRILDLNCGEIGLPPEARKFHPHLTIARLRSARDARVLGDLHKTSGFESTTVEVRELSLMRSELSSQGSRYIALARHYLNENTVSTKTK
ncbi:MAG TPA: RNA 2',3'-cyclic phosphodiesterase [Pyrinomonadaceae bacterium]|jgi:2'-5' RNA ligase|nr:RNA 2',3'-cyclic phosphodiesterase [Pyrinomonadaceae bacterium]